MQQHITHKQTFVKIIKIEDLRAKYIVRAEPFGRDPIQYMKLVYVQNILRK